jgi:hypothetical protein
MKVNYRKKPINLIVFILGIWIIITGWYNVYNLTSDLKLAVMSSYLNSQLNIIKIIALQIEKNSSIKKIKQQHVKQDIKKVSEIIKSSLIELNYDQNKKEAFSNYGDIWIVSPGTKYTKLIFPTLNIKLDISEYFNLNTGHKSAKYCDKLLVLLKEKTQGTGWYINNKDKLHSNKYMPWWEHMLHHTGKTLVTFVPFTFNGKTWMIGVNTLLPKLLRTTGSYKYINGAILQMLSATFIVIVFLLILQLFSLKILKLNSKLNTLKIEIDEIHKEQQTSEILESDYFKKIREIADKL